MDQPPLFNNEIKAPTNADLEREAPKHGKWFLLFAFILVIIGGVSAFHKSDYYLYTPFANLIGDIAIPMKDTKLDSLHFCGPMLVAKKKDVTCIASLFPKNCIFKFEGDVPVGINSLTQTVAIGQDLGVRTEIAIFKQCVNGDFKAPERECNGADDVNCTMLGDPQVIKEQPGAP